LSTSGTCWIGGWGLGSFPLEMSGNLQEEWRNISQQELANLVQSMRRCTAVLIAAGGHIRYWLLHLILLFRVTLFHLLVTCLWNLFRSSQLNLMFIQIFTR
jgi:hypothetical protein